jgi:hydroxyethylthiazole kinase
VEAAKDFALKMKSVAAVTGRTDIVTNGQKVYLLDNGHPILTGVTGTGCMTSALVGTFVGQQTIRSLQLLPVYSPWDGR